MHVPVSLKEVPANVYSIYSQIFDQWILLLLLYIKMTRSSAGSSIDQILLDLKSRVATNLFCYFYMYVLVRARPFKVASQFNKGAASPPFKQAPVPLWLLPPLLACANHTCVCLCACLYSVRNCVK